MTGFTWTLGTGLLAIGFTAQYLLKKKLKHAQTRQIYSWIAWGGALLGGTSVSLNFGHAAGITARGAAIVSAIMLLALAVDLVDKKPDWPAFFIAAIVPSFMALAAGTNIGGAYALLLAAPQQLAIGVGNLFGFGA